MKVADLDKAFISETLAPYVVAAALPFERHEAKASCDRIENALEAFVSEHQPCLKHLDLVDAARVCAAEDDLHLMAGDGRMQPSGWLRIPDGKILKRNATGTDCDHSWAGQQSILWDVVGAEIEWRMSHTARQYFHDCLEDEGLDMPKFPLSFHRAGYCCLHLAQAQHSGEQAAADYYRCILNDELARLACMV